MVKDFLVKVFFRRGSWYLDFWVWEGIDLVCFLSIGMEMLMFVNLEKES